jgi:hypothetical protein
MARDQFENQQECDSHFKYQNREQALRAVKGTSKKYGKLMPKKCGTHWHVVHERKEPKRRKRY